MSIETALREAAYSKDRTHGIHDHDGADCREYVVGECIVRAALGIAALADPWLDDIIRCLEVGMGKWQDEHRIPGQIGAWQFKGADGPFHELTQSTLRRLKDYRAAHKVRDAIPAEPIGASSTCPSAPSSASPPGAWASCP